MATTPPSHRATIGSCQLYGCCFNLFVVFRFHHVLSTKLLSVLALIMYTSKIFTLILSVSCEILRQIIKAPSRYVISENTGLKDKFQVLNGKRQKFCRDNATRQAITDSRHINSESSVDHKGSLFDGLNTVCYWTHYAYRLNDIRCRLSK